MDMNAYEVFVNDLLVFSSVIKRESLAVFREWIGHAANRTSIAHDAWIMLTVNGFEIDYYDRRVEQRLIAEIVNEACECIPT